MKTLPSLNAASASALAWWRLGSERGLVAGHAHAAAAAAGRRLDEYRVTGRARELHRLIVGLDESLAAGNGGHLRGLRDCLGLVLVAELVHRRDGRADELDADSRHCSANLLFSERKP